jgi:hypothetical protein
MPTRDEVILEPLSQQLDRLAQTADHLAADIRDHGEAMLVRRPDAANWAAKEIICHLRDTEELSLLRLELIAAVDEPFIPAAGLGARALALKSDGQPAAPERWAEDRQYLRNDATPALAAFRRRREEVLAHLRGLAPEQWRRGGIHARRGRVTVADFVAEMACHDDNHREQLRRALQGRL